ncbi:MAG: IS200/IS605 family transposase [Pseudomonadota bacterium]
MSTYTQIYYHIVFSTKNREPVLMSGARETLFRYIWSVVSRNNGRLYRINGTTDHLHVLTNLHPTVSLSVFVKEIKATSSYWIHKTNLFPEFSNWQPGYGAFTHSIRDLDRLVEYIKRQEEHHRVLSFAEEFDALLVESGLDPAAQGIRDGVEKPD